MLDPQGRREVLKAVTRLNREHQMTVVLITHHMSEAALADRVVVMSEGAVIADGTPKEVFVQVDRLQSVGLTVPETTLLLHELNREGYDLPLDALSVDECAQALQMFLKQA